MNNCKDDGVTRYACNCWSHHLHSALSYEAGDHLLSQSKDSLVNPIQKLAGDMFEHWRAIRVSWDPYELQLVELQLYVGGFTAALFITNFLTKHRDPRIRKSAAKAST